MAARQVPIVVTELSSAAPNPFSRATGIRYQLAREGHAKLSVFDATGRVVRTLVDCRQKPGMFTVTWNGTDNRQRSVPRGVYFVKLDAPQYTGQRKVTLTR
jgi:flagellar hook assembly protein FlgD